MLFYRALFWIPEGNVFLGMSLLAALGGGFSLGTYHISMYTIVTVRFVQDINIILVSVFAIVEILVPFNGFIKSNPQSERMWKRQHG